jgi:hypothetical protein
MVTLMPGRPRTPTAVLEASGAFAKNPKRGRDRHGEPKSTGGVGEPPAVFKADGEYYELWKEISASAPWLDAANRGGLEALCRVRYNIRHAIGKFNANVASQSKLENDLGITQASRSRCNVPSKPPERAGGEWQDLAEEGRRARPN